MANPIEKARAIIAKGEKAIEGPWFSQGTTVGHAIPRLTVRYDDNGRLHESVEAEAEKLADTGSDNDADYIAAANPADLLPLLRLLVECEEVLEPAWRVAYGEHYFPLADKLEALIKKLRSES